MRVRVWKQMHIRDADWLTLCVIRVERPQAADTKRDPRISWFVWIGDEHADAGPGWLCATFIVSERRHGYRIDRAALVLGKRAARV